MKRDIIINAGGLGRRLWPISTYDKPKQFLSLDSNISFLQATILRSLKLQCDGFILLVTRYDLQTMCNNQIQELLELLSAEQRQNLLERLILILEPFCKGTANSVFFAMHYLRAFRKENSSVLLLPSDHIIGPYENFEKDIEKGFSINPNDKIVCYGIEPTYPAINYGYIQKGKNLQINNINFEDVFFVPSFHEKPKLEKAKIFLEKGKYLWNTAIYTFPLDLMFDEYKAYQNEIFAAFKSFSKNSFQTSYVNEINTILPAKEIYESYKKTPRLSFDFGITTYTKKACVLKSTFSWEDVGNWDSFSTLFTPPIENHIEIEAENNFIFSDIPVAICGLENIHVIIKNGEALILQKGKAELVKDAYIQLKIIKKT